MTQLRAKAAAATAGAAYSGAAALQACWMIGIGVDAQQEGRHRPTGPLGRLTAIAAAWCVGRRGSCRQDRIYNVLQPPSAPMERSNGHAVGAAAALAAYDEFAACFLCLRPIEHHC